MAINVRRLNWDDKLRRAVYRNEHGSSVTRNARRKPVLLSTTQETRSVRRFWNSSEGRLFPNLYEPPSSLKKPPGSP